MNIMLDTTLLLYAGTALVLLITVFIVVRRFQGPKIDKVSREQLKILKTAELNVRKNTQSRRTHIVRRVKPHIP